MKQRKTRRLAGLVATVAALALFATACGSDGGNEASDQGGGGGKGTVTLGILPSWTDGLSMAHLWTNVLEEKGYTVEVKELSEAAPLFTGVANGDIDVYPSAWPKVTHADYMDEYGDQLEILGNYYEGAKLTWAVPKYMEDINSIADLQGKASRFDGEVIGIEPSAGLTDTSKNSVIPEYNLGDNYTLKTSSTTAMLAELESAVQNEEDIVVTLWRPFWANSEYPVKDLKDPKGALGKSEPLSAVATKGFSEEMPQVAEMMSNAKLSDKEYGALEKAVVDAPEGEKGAAAQAWLDEHPDWVASLSS